MNIAMMNPSRTGSYTRLYVFATIAIVGGAIQCAGGVGLVVFLLIQDAPLMLLPFALVMLAGGLVGILSGPLIHCLRDVARGEVELVRPGFDVP